jgi:hypothetical protein
MHFPSAVSVVLLALVNVSACILPPLPAMAVPPEIAQIITAKKLQYGRFVDTHQWDKFASQVAFPECTFEYTDHGKLIVDKGFEYKWATTADFVGFFSVAFETLQTMHHVGPGEFTWLAVDEVEAIFPIVYHSALAKGANSTQGVTGTGGGHYYETYKRKGTDWFMKKCRMDRIYEIAH